ncbi:MAG: DUF4377 domain-containing protein [Prevotella stercorea]|nr:DUF4377 domain-containing protein [Leyella stercorea]
MQYIQNLPFILSSTIKRKMKKTLNLLFLLLAVFAVSSCSSDDDEKKDSVKEITIYVSSETGESYGFNSTPEECMLVKFDNPNGEWEHLGLYRIEGFTYVKGHEYELRVKMTTLANPPADGYSHKYLLVKIVQDKLVKETGTPTDNSVKSESDIEYQELCPYNKYETEDNYIVDGEGNIYKGNGLPKPSYEHSRIYVENVLDKGDDNWVKFNSIPYQAYRSYVISPLTDDIRLVYNEDGGPLFKDVIPESEFEYITKKMNSGEKLQYFLILANVYKKGLQKLKFTITKQ